MASIRSKALTGRVSYRYDLDGAGDSGDSGAVDAAARNRAVAEYLADMIGQLEGMARLSRLDLVAYLLSMAKVEAQTQAREMQEDARGSRYSA
jgi:hypothetical protein